MLSNYVPSLLVKIFAFPKYGNMFKMLDQLTLSAYL